MTSLLHRFDNEDGFAERMRRAEFKYLCQSEDYQRVLATNYVGLLLGGDAEMNAYTQVMSDRFEVVVPSAPEGMDPLEWEARLELAACYRIVACYGWTSVVYNHITLRIQKHHIS